MTPSRRDVVELVDRFFVLIVVGFFLLLPDSGWASVMFESWFDQKRDLAALRSVLADGVPTRSRDNVIGPAYIGAAAVVHDVNASRVRGRSRRAHTRRLRADGRRWASLLVRRSCGG